MSDKQPLYNSEDEQPVIDGLLDLTLKASVQQDEFNNGFKMSIGNSEVSLKTTSEVVKNPDGTISEETFVDDNALVRAETLRTFVETQNDMMSSVKYSVERIGGKAVPQFGGMGYQSGTVVTFVIDGCDATLGTKLLPLFEKAGIKPTVAVNPEFIVQGFGVKGNGDTYNVLSVTDIQKLRDNGYDICDTITPDYQKSSNPDTLQNTLDDSQLWMMRNGLNSNVFLYPCAVDSRIKSAIKKMRQAAVRFDGTGINGIEADAYELSVASVNAEGITLVQEQMAEASSGNVLFIVKLDSSAEDADFAASLLIEQSKSLNLRCMNFQQAVNAKVRAFNIGDKEQFYVRKDGVTRAVLDDYSISRLCERLEFENLSEGFKNALADFVVSVFSKTPAKDVNLTIDGMMFEDGMKLKSGEYQLGFDIDPVNASLSNKVTVSILDGTTNKYASITSNNKLIIDKPTVANVSWTADSDAENGLIVDEQEQTIEGLKLHLQLVSLDRTVIKKTYSFDVL